MGKKVILYVICCACIISLPAAMISSEVAVMAGSSDLYKWGFDKYMISARTGIDRVNLNKAGDAMAGYLTGILETPQVDVEIGGKIRLLYNQKEIIHLADVRGIILFFQILLLASVITLITTCVALYKMRGLVKMLNTVILGDLITLGGTVLLVIWALVDFDSLFYLFHIASFNNNLWLLDPSKDYLIRLFPQGFFNDAAILLVGSIIIVSVIVFAVAAVIKKSVTRDAGRLKLKPDID